MNFEPRSDCVLIFAPSPEPPGREDVSEFQSTHSYSGGCASLDRVRHIPTQCVECQASPGHTYVPFSGRDITLVDHRNKRCLVNGYQ